MNVEKGLTPLRVLRTFFRITAIIFLLVPFSFTVDDSVIAEVLRRETDRSLGARPLRRAFERLVEGPLAEEVVAGRLHRGAKLRLACNASGTLAISALI